MNDPLQEKFQILAPGKVESGEGWTSFESARRPRPQNGLVLPSTEIEEPTLTSMRLDLAGATDVTDCVNVPDINRGFVKGKMSPTDEEYTGEHVDLFYGDSGGFVERNNYLDRA